MAIFRIRADRVPVGGRATSGRDGRRLERFAKMREGLTSRGRSHPGLLPLANLRFEVSRLLPAVSSERDAAPAVRALKRKLLRDPRHEFRPSSPRPVGSFVSRQQLADFGSSSSRCMRNHRTPRRRASLESHESNPKAIFRARSSSLILAEENCPISRTSRCCGTVRMLSVLTTDGLGSPSALPTETSVGSPREVRVTRATTTAPIVSLTVSLVSTTTGRGPTGGGSSAHQTSALRIGPGRSAAPLNHLNLGQLRQEG